MQINKKIQQEIQIWRTQISPPRQILDTSINPNQSDIIKLTNKTISNEQAKKKQKQSSVINTNITQNIQRIQYNQNQYQTLFYRYADTQPIYRRYNNQGHNKLCRKKYFSSFFFKPDAVKKKNMSIFSSFDQYKNLEQNKNLDNRLKFNAEFQSGNLYAAYKINQNQYDLIMQNDTNSKGNNQWYYFSISNTRKNHNIKINIINFYKSSSLYNQGMKPLVYSTKANKNPKGPGWGRYGSSINYYQSQIKIQNNPNNRNYFSLTFQYKFDFDDDTVFFANCYPYTLTNLNDFLKAINVNQNIVMIKTIGTSILKNNINMIMIGEDIKQKDRKYKLPSKFMENKQSIIIMARQHPGQTPGSYICQGFVKSLLQQSNQAKFLLNHFNFFIFPMINIDGVINGNYRGNAFGFDLNRLWAKQKLQLNPQIYYIKNQIRKIAKRSNIHLILDFHGHSKKLNSFFFGNIDEKDPNIPQIFPLMASKASSHISFKSSTFSESQDKKNTARLVLKQQLKHHKDCQIFTFQASFYGTIKNGKKVHFTTDDYRNMGKTLIQTLYRKQFQDFKQFKTLKESAVLKQIHKQLLKINKMNPSEKIIDGSDSQVQDYNQQDQQILFKGLNIITDLNYSYSPLNNQQITQTPKVISNLMQKPSLMMKSQYSQVKKQKMNKTFMGKFLTPQARQSRTELKQTQPKFSGINFNQIKLDSMLSEQKSKQRQTSPEIQKSKHKYLNQVLFKMNVKGTPYQQMVRGILHKDNNIKSILKSKDGKYSGINSPKSLKDNDFYLYNLSMSQKKRRRQQLYNINFRVENQRRNTLDIQNVNQMIKIRKINFRIKAITNSFKQDFAQKTRDMN